MPTKVMERRDDKKAPMLIFVNKIDIPNALPVMEVIKAMELPKLLKNETRKIKIQPCSAINGFGLSEGLDWLSEQLGVKIM